ncbi:glycosyltransferase family 4 protein [Acaryochloris sp. IP29b_bin.137]|uniref:glycosyltransferase family 4 protein n=1 Tax=Acaryochloris sp. IP29b_bin.137 TaxID=2969217 RepID=UPI0026176EA3|nr:glycosyltransferase family 4 protein [Acaryochloris sp. IP29b_bin.137]
MKESINAHTMKILHLSTSDLDGGAAKAAYRLHQGLRAIGANSQMLVRARDGADRHVFVEKTAQTRLGPIMNGLPLRRYKRRSRNMFSTQWFPDTLANRVNALNPDIVVLHWICNGFLQIETLAKVRQPKVWVVHDMWPFTGGCHYTQDCDRYTQSCGACPQLNSQSSQDLSHKVWKRKKQAWQAINLTLIAPSQWLAQVIQSSSLFHHRRTEVIHHGLDLELFRPLDRNFARDALKLPQNKDIVLFGASSGVTNDPRKGFHFLQSALNQLRETNALDRLEIAIFGISEPQEPLELGFPVHYLGRLRDELSLVLAYSAASIMVVPSTHETFGQTASEALACGTPVVAFDATGPKDIVEHQGNGYLAQPFESRDLAQGILWILEDLNRYQQLCINARQKTEENFNLEIQSRQYESLFHEIISAG